MSLYFNIQEPVSGEAPREQGCPPRNRGRHRPAPGFEEKAQPQLRLQATRATRTHMMNA